MKKIAIITAMLAASAGHALAGGYAAPVVEAEPVVVEEQASSSSGGLLIPALLLIAVAAASLGRALRYEASRGGALFPHLYAPMPLAAVAWVKPLPLDAAGVHAFPVLDR